ncbi:MAG: PilZ domain-containing protein, partial [Candidatus Omnitrophica bacterium]|nr:PilZ domain-containing protein [Candidatus Omnitrophota bacterium]
EHLGQENRHYLRLDTVFPVQFRLVALDGRGFLSAWLQGFTNNLSKGGICLSVNNLPPEALQLLQERKVKLALEIDLPITRKPIVALAIPVWISGVPDAAHKYYIGLHYEEIDAAQSNKLMRYALGKKLLVPAALGIIVLLGLGLVVNSLISIKLIEGNRALVRRLVNVIQESALAKQKIRDVSKEKESLQRKIQELTARIQAVEDEKARLGGKTTLELGEQSRKINELSTLIQQLSQEKNNLKEELAALQLEESVAFEELVRIDKKRTALAKANLEKMYQWLQRHQDPHTGLVMSFEGDSHISGWAFIYDQSLVMQAYTYFSDFERCRKMLDFFNHKAKKKNDLFFNTYYVNDGEPAEYIVHSGPNIWLGIAIVQYTYKTKDNRYINLAEDIAQGVINLQKQDAEGGVRGGPEIEWYSTEHNLDAYAFFNMLHRLTGKQQYIEARDKVLEWLVKHAYHKMDIPIQRGKGDATIATDTYAWSIAALGPRRLEELGMNPDRIMEFAENNCAVEVSYTRPEGQVIKIKGFDFAPERHAGRGGIVSSEWTAQMVVAFKIMADFYFKKGEDARGQLYQSKAEDYLASLANMLISSPSPSGQGEGCLPYATQESIDTGHGWFTPRGKTTGSVAGTTYAIFAYYNYNPLELKD